MKRFEPESRNDRNQAEFQIRRKKKKQKDGLIFQKTVDKAYLQLKEAAQEQIALLHYIFQINNMQVAFSVKQQKLTTIDNTVSALEMESYLGPKLEVAEVFYTTKGERINCSISGT